MIIYVIASLRNTFAALSSAATARRRNAVFVSDGERGISMLAPPGGSVRERAGGFD